MLFWLIFGGYVCMIVLSSIVITKLDFQDTYDCIERYDKDPNEYSKDMEDWRKKWTRSETQKQIYITERKKEAATLGFWLSFVWPLVLLLCVIGVFIVGTQVAIEQLTKLAESKYHKEQRREIEVREAYKILDKWNAEGKADWERKFLEGSK